MVTYKINAISAITSRKVTCENTRTDCSVYDVWFWSPDNQQKPQFQVQVAAPRWWTSRFLLAAVNVTIKQQNQVVIYEEMVIGILNDAMAPFNSINDVATSFFQLNQEQLLEIFYNNHAFAQVEGGDHE